MKMPDEVMTWRPPSVIKVKVIGVADHQNHLLVFEVLDDNGKVKGWRPIGGGIEFGETAKEALRREIFEELGCHVVIQGSPLVCENIFEHHGAIGHEIIFAFKITLGNPEIYEKKRFQIREVDGAKHWVEWVARERFKNGEETLYPPALVEQLLTMDVGEEEKAGL